MAFFNSPEQWEVILNLHKKALLKQAFVNVNKPFLKPHTHVAPSVKDPTLTPVRVFSS